jgi:hypothetical protein
MQRNLLFTFVVLSPILVFSQHPNTQAKEDLVKNAVGTIAGSKRPKVELVLNDLREFKGKIVAVYPDHFIFEPKSDDGLLTIKIPIVTIGSVPKPARIRIKYADVLQLKGNKGILSFVPDPKARPYSAWSEMGALGRGEFLQVHLSNGRKLHGVYFRSAPDSLSLLKGDKVVVIPASDVMKVYRVKGDTRSVASKIADGGMRGTRVSEDWLPIGDPRGSANPAALAIGAAVGATLYLLSSGRTERVLMFSR